MFSPKTPWYYIELVKLKQLFYEDSIYLAVLFLKIGNLNSLVIPTLKPSGDHSTKLQTGVSLSYLRDYLTSYGLKLPLYDSATAILLPIFLVSKNRLDSRNKFFVIWSVDCCKKGEIAEVKEAEGYTKLILG